jgi:hypothetical protein
VRRPGILDRLFYEDDPPAGGESGENVLGTLVDEVPAKMRVGDERQRIMHERALRTSRVAFRADASAEIVTWH